MAVTAVPQPESPRAPHVRVEVTGAPASRTLSLVGVRNGGGSYEVRGGVNVGPDGRGFTEDYDVPFGEPLSYRLADGQTSPGTRIDYPRPSLVDPFRPTTFVRLDPQHIGRETFDDLTDPTQATTLRPGGRPGGGIHISSGQRGPEQGTMVLIAHTLQELQRFRDLLRPDTPLLWRAPPTGPWELTYAWIGPGSVNRGRRGRPVSSSRRFVSFPYELVDRPEGGFRPTRTYADALAAQGTYNDSAATYSTYFERSVERVRS